MTRVADVISFMEQLAPPSLAESWDNIGLLLGDRTSELAAAMTCLTLTHDVAEEAIAGGADIVLCHHPILFRPVQRLTADSPEGRMLLELARAGVAVYSGHTGYDSAGDGINQQLAELLELSDISPLRTSAPRLEKGGAGEAFDPAHGSPASLGAGRCGRLPSPTRLGQLLEVIKQRLDLVHLQYVGDATTEIRRVGIACGSAAEFIADARHLDCQVLVTGEARFHACLEARAIGMALVLVGHYASERPAMERLADVLKQRFPELDVWASRNESDPVQWS